MDDDLSRTLRTRDEPRETEAEAGQEAEEEAELTTTSNGSSSIIGREPNRTADHGRCATPQGHNFNSQGRPLPEDSANTSNNNNGEPAGDMNHVAGRAAGRSLIGDGHEPLDSRFRELREMLPPPPADAAAGAGSLPPGQESNGGVSSQHEGAGGPTTDAEMEDEEVDLLERARLRILALEREQRVLAEQNGQLESLLSNRARQQHEDRPDKGEDED
ncbi:hypothetical protein QBC47DRAFT_405166 [Echria macrotheca]|uniref:Uncharacterized protein n=1 Tax=Echria macrotheca TaxID=438768 RepID=A0AAJ0B880_9PEZI|nr:hypothetical protein QBC47DRAFT_405166 [Echria macrotheca]